MPHANGKIYSEVVNGVKVGINTDDVVAVLGVASHDAKTLCMSSNIRKFSRHKPVRRNSPDDTDFDNDNSQNNSGIYAGQMSNYTAGPVYWGLRYPMTTQVHAGVASNKLFPLCWAITKGQANCPNYEYEKLQSNDFGRLTDFDGYSHNAKEFLVAGVSYAQETDTYAEIDIDIVGSTDPVIGIYGAVPGDCGDNWKLRDLIPDAVDYRLVAEFYKWTDYMYATKSTLATIAPFAVFCSRRTMADTTNMYDLSFAVPVSEIRTAYGSGFPTNGNSLSLCVCVGFNKVTSSPTNPVGDSAYKLPASYCSFQELGFIAPWKGGTSTKSITCVTFTTNAKYIITPTQYASILYPTYKDFPMTKTPYHEDNMRFKIVAQNTGTSNLYICSNSTTNGMSGLRFRVSAHGRFNETGNGSYIKDGDYTKGPAAPLRIFSDAACTTEINSMAVPAGTTQTFYGSATGFIPYGNVSLFIFELTADNGGLWTINGAIECNFEVS